MNKEEYLTKIRAAYEKEGNSLEGYETEADFISDLAEDGWNDSDKWLTIWGRLHNGGELTPRERECAIAYFEAGDCGIEGIPAEYRL